MARRLNLDGDGQGDLNGHGGPNRAILVYQNEAYAYWRHYLGRDDLRPGAFGENFTVSGLADDEVCIGDRYRIGEAEFEVSQPRVTCFRLGMRLGEPELPQLLVAHHRPGFYLRVVTEGCVQAGDEIIRTRQGRHGLSVAEIDALLYLPDRDPGQLRLAVDMPALSPGWVQSFRELLEPVPADSPAWEGFRELRVTALHRESPTVLSVELSSDTPLPPAAAGQYLLIRADGAADPAPLRSYSLSAATASGSYRISVKREPAGVVSQWIHSVLRVGATLHAAAPRGDFRLTDGNRPVLLVSAGIGITPLLAMLHSLTAVGTCRRVVWLHTTRDRASEAFAGEVCDLINRLPDAQLQVFYTGGTPVQRLDAGAVARLDLPRDAEAYLCGPASFMDAMRDALVAKGLQPSAIYSEVFGSLPAINPGAVSGGQVTRPHPPSGPPATGPKVTFARVGLTVRWSPSRRSLLELAEDCDVPTRYSCRSGVCHICATGLVAGEVAYPRQPLESAEPGMALICCATPLNDLVLDL